MPALAWVSPTYKGAGEGTAGLVWASPPPTFHASGLQMEHMLGRGREGEVLPGKAVPAPYPGSGHCVRLDSGGGWKCALIQDLASRGGSLTQRRLSGSDPSALTQAQWVEFRQQEKMSRLPSPLWGRCSSPLHDAQQQGGHRWAGRRQCHMSAGGSGCGGAAPVQSWRTPPRGRRGWGDGSRVRGDSTRPSGSAPRGPSSGSWGAAPGFPGVRAWVLVRVGAVPPDSTHQRISSLANALLSLSGLRWPQDLKHSQPG